MALPYQMADGVAANGEEWDRLADQQEATTDLREHHGR